MADITAYDTRINGVNQDTDFVREEAHVIDFGLYSEIAEAGTHDLFVLPVGEAVIGIRVIGLESLDAGTLQFLLKHGDEEAVTVNETALTTAELAEGVVNELAVSGIKAYDGENTCTVQATVGSAITEGKILIIIETIPVLDFLTNG